MKENVLILSNWPIRIICSVNISFFLSVTSPIGSNYRCKCLVNSLLTWMCSFDIRFDTELFEGWEAEGRKWHFTNFTGEPKQKFYLSLIWLCVLISIVYNKNLYTHGWQYICQKELIKSFHLIYISPFHQKFNLRHSGSHPSFWILSLGFRRFHLRNKTMVG